MTRSEIFFESYNMSIEAAYDAYFKIAQKDILKGLSGNEEELRCYMDNETAKWSGTPLSELGGMTPVEYLNSVDTLEDLLGVFREGAMMCDDGLPDVFLEKLRSYGDEAVRALLGICAELPAQDASGPSSMIPLMAVRVLGEWKITESVDTLMRMLDCKGDLCDLLYEKIGVALKNIGKPAIDSIIKEIESRDVNSTPVEYLLMALADTASGSRSDAAYRCLKNSFLNMGNKSVGAYCLGNYGDGRAIPALRGYLIKNRGDVNKDTFYDITSSIRRLGGNADDFGVWED